MFRFLILLSTMAVFTGCSEPVSHHDSPSAQEIIATSVLFHGGSVYDSVNVSFVFRDKKYRGNWTPGSFSYQREFQAEDQLVQDVLTNESFERKIDGQIIPVPDTMAQKYSASVNSVWYFAMLPYRLLDPAVQLRQLGDGSIRGKTYHKLEVTFTAEGGGEDFEDVFVYWFDKKDFSMDYLAYSYAEDHGLGIRFREAINPRRVGGILFQDYVNYKADPAVYEVYQLDAAFTEGKLDTLSMIELEDVQVE